MQESSYNWYTRCFINVAIKWLPGVLIAGVWKYCFWVPSQYFIVDFETDHANTVQYITISYLK